MILYYNRSWQMEKEKLDFKTKVSILFSIIVPGLVTAFIDFDIGQFATYIVAASILGFKIFIPLFFAYCIAIIIQSVNGRINIVTNRGIIELIRERYGIATSLGIFIAIVILNFGALIQSMTGLYLSGQLLHYNGNFFMLVSLIFLTTIVFTRLHRNIPKLFLFVAVFYAILYFNALIKAAGTSLHQEQFMLPLQAIKQIQTPFLFIALLGTTVTPWTLFFITRYTYKAKLDLDHLEYFIWENYADTILLFVFSCIFMVGAILSLQNVPFIQHPLLITKLLTPLITHNREMIMAAGIFLLSLVSFNIVLLSTTHAYLEFFGAGATEEERLENSLGYKIFFIIFAALTIIVINVLRLSLFNVTVTVDFLNGLFLLVFLYLIFIFGNDRELMGRHKNTLKHNVGLIATALLLLVSLAFIFVLKILPIPS